MSPNSPCRVTSCHNGKSFIITQEDIDTYFSFKEPTSLYGYAPGNHKMQIAMDWLLGKLKTIGSPLVYTVTDLPKEETDV